MLRECVCRSQLRESRALKVADVVLLVVEDGCVFSLQARLSFIVTSVLLETCSPQRARPYCTVGFGTVGGPGGGAG